MKEVNVIVVPQSDEYTFDVSHNGTVWINGNLGTPRLDERNVKYLAPYWLNPDNRGVYRIYHILEHYKLNNENNTYEIILGNSFVLDNKWDNVGNSRRFEYHKLKDFGFVEIKDGLLLDVNKQI
ncbi:hypothetical protein [Capnocytophaga cynodegmi]|uniref:hypothetical protein n=1 Tax=Capnocytophaga cynodegmi TaxID=28189 RepID=UPI001AC01BE7|nr:hypothetical protein [Capnocytophaga cynodegmi]GIM54572.1 hypothetical protein CAPN005_12190 [Capnocytophaga cynodegmi]GJQ06873.1 hypothetical protein CAPN010_10310 [Capnocytophaga cynodegmi]